MKFIKIAFLFLLVFGLIQASCSDLNKSKIILTNGDVDSLDFHLLEMSNATLSDSICLFHSGKALKLANNKKFASKKKEIIRYRTYLFGKMRMYDSAIYNSKISLKQLEKDNTNSLAQLYSELGYYYRANSQNDSAYYYYYHSNKIYNKLLDSSRIGENLYNIAIIQSALGDYVESQATGIRAISYLDKNNLKYLSSIYNSLAISSRKQNDNNEALYWYSKSLSIASDRLDSISVLNNRAVAFRYLENYDESIIILTDLLEDSNLNKKQRTKAKVIDNLAYAKWLRNKTLNVLSEFEFAKNIRKQENDMMGLIASYAHLSEYNKVDNPKTALKQANKMYQLATNLKSPQDRLEALEKLINLGDFKNLKGYYSTSIRISDSLNKAKEYSRNKFAKLKYDNKKNREENLQLKIVSATKELELQKEKTRNILGAFSMGVVVLGFIGFEFYRKKKHNLEKREEVYKMETQIAKKIHDEVANNVVSIMNKVQYTKEPKEKLLDDLEKVYLITRNISHQNKQIETGKYYLNSLKNLIKSFNSKATHVILKNISSVGLEYLRENKQIEIYRVLQELMVNMQKHSGANLVAVTFKKEKRTIKINYADNGIGVDLNDIKIRNGLSNMENRIKSINGYITFESSLNNGFKVYINFKE